MDDHREMVDLLAARDADGLAELVTAHLTRTEQALREGYLALRSSRDGL
jgi:DNA-binding GntR family transcriptional regulator